MLKDFLDKFCLNDYNDVRQVIEINDDMINIEFVYSEVSYIKSVIISYLDNNNIRYHLDREINIYPNYILQNLIIYF
jgi:hypothetical protein